MFDVDLSPYIQIYPNPSVADYSIEQPLIPSNFQQPSDYDAYDNSIAFGHIYGNFMVTFLTSYWAACSCSSYFFEIDRVKYNQNANYCTVPYTYSNSWKYYGVFRVTPACKP